MSRSTKAEMREKFQDEPYPIHFVGRNIEITEAMKTYAIEKLQKIEHFGGRVASATVTMGMQRGIFEIDYLVDINDKKIRVRGLDRNMYAAIDQAIDHLKLILTRYTRKLHEHHGKGMKDIELSIQIGGTLLDEVNDQIDEANLTAQEQQLTPGTIVKREKTLLKLLSEKEAILYMDVISTPWLVYRSEEDGKIKTLYRLSGGNYGIFDHE